MTYLHSLTRAARFAFQWRLFVLWLAALALPSLVMVGPLASFFSDQLDNSVYAPGLAQRLDGDNIADLISQLVALPTLREGAIPAIILLALLVPFISGMTLAAAGSSRAPGFGELMRAGRGDYWRMVRMSLWSLVPLGIAMALGGGAAKLAEWYSEHATIANYADYADYAAQIVYLVVFMLAQLSVEAARAQLAIKSKSRSVIMAWLRGIGALRRRPRASLLSFFVITIVGSVAAFGFTVLRLNLNAVGPLMFVGALIVAEAVVVSLAWMKTARLVALTDLARPGGPSRAPRRAHAA
jgi:hypothetical protein